MPRFEKPREDLAHQADLADAMTALGWLLLRNNEDGLDFHNQDDYSDHFYAENWKEIETMFDKMLFDNPDNEVCIKIEQILHPERFPIESSVVYFPTLSEHGFHGVQAIDLSRTHWNGDKATYRGVEYDLSNVRLYANEQAASNAYYDSVYADEVNESGRINEDFHHYESSARDIVVLDADHKPHYEKQTELKYDLPAQCYALHPQTNEVILLKQGEDGFYFTDIETTDKEENQKIVDSRNARYGVTPEQVEFMLAYSQHGWPEQAAEVDQAIQQAEQEVTTGEVVRETEEKPLEGDLVSRLSEQFKPGDQVEVDFHDGGNIATGSVVDIDDLGFVNVKLDDDGSIMPIDPISAKIEKQTEQEHEFAME